jgi:hypothetical protein
MNHCGEWLFYARWRTLCPDVPVEVTLGGMTGLAGVVTITEPESITSTSGWMVGTNCRQPVFRVPDEADRSALADVVVEVQQWTAAVP